MKSKILCLMGPTAAGKTELSLTLADELQAEIVSVDSAMVYKGMDIGTAKPSANIRENIPHYLIDIVLPTEPYSAARFMDDAYAAIHSIQAKGRIPLLVGGTMLYFKVLQQGLSPLPSANQEVREKLAKEAEQVGWSQMHARLACLDPDAARRINPNDPQRIQRALEVYTITQKPLSELFQIKQQQASFEFINIALAPVDRTSLHKRIEARFYTMLEEGFLQEVETLYHSQTLNSHLPAMRSVGYRQAWRYLDGEITYKEMIEQGISATRQLAKRQITWLRSWSHVNWFDTTDESCYQQLCDFVAGA